MKIKNINKLWVVPFASLMLTSCLDFDVTGSEFSQTQKNLENVTRHGKVDEINYLQNITQDEFNEAMSAISDNLSQAKSGTYVLRGGKEGGTPGPHAYQYQFSLGTDFYAQYGVSPHVNYPYSGIKMASSYAIDKGAYGGAYGHFILAGQYFVPLLNMEEVDKLPEIKAIYLLLYNYAAIQAADVYGPLPYQDLKTNKQEHPYTYDNVQTIYETSINNIDTIVKCLQHFDTREQWYKDKILKALGKNLPLYTKSLKGDAQGIDKIIRLANSFKLRLAMRVVKANPNKARQWAEEAVANGVIEEPNQEAALYPIRMGTKNPIAQIWNEWGDMRLSAGLEAVLRAFNHPYLKYLFLKNERIQNKKNKDIVLEPGTRVCGIRTGTHVDAEQNGATNPYNGFSKINENYVGTAPMYIMKLSEVYFLRAEGAIRGWNMGGTAQDFYNKGIEYSDMQDRQSALIKWDENELSQYMQQDEATPFIYEDPTGETPNIESTITIGVKWNEGDSQETKLEKIITQKYIASFPNSLEAWNDMRRTGYPRLFEVLNPKDGDGSIAEGDIIRRLPFPNKEDASTLKDIIATGIKALGNLPDKQATRLWWDVDAPNF